MTSNRSNLWWTSLGVFMTNSKVLTLTHTHTHTRSYVTVCWVTSPLLWQFEVSDGHMINFIMLFSKHQNLLRFFFNKSSLNNSNVHLTTIIAALSPHLLNNSCQRGCKIGLVIWKSQFMTFTVYSCDGQVPLQS